MTIAIGSILGVISIVEEYGPMLGKVIGAMTDNETVNEVTDFVTTHGANAARTVIESIDKTHITAEDFRAGAEKILTSDDFLKEAQERAGLR